MKMTKNRNAERLSPEEIQAVLDCIKGDDAIDKDQVMRELNRDINDIDTDMIDALVNGEATLDSSANPDDELRKILESDDKRHSRQKQDRRRFLLRFAIVVILLLSVSLSISTVRAWYWNGLVKVFSPVLEYLGFTKQADDMSDVDKDSNERLYAQSDEIHMSSDNTEAVFETYNSLADMPEFIGGKRTKFSSALQGIELVSAEYFRGMGAEQLDATYLYEDRTFYVSVVEFAEQMSIFGVVEKKAEDVSIHSINGNAIEITHNMDMINVVVNIGSGMYHLYGDISEDAVLKIFTELLGGTTP